MFFLAAIHNEGSVLELFSNNLINWLVLVGLIVWMWNKYMPATLAQRKNGIELALQNALAAKQEGEVFLAEQKKKLEQAEKESDKIVSEAKQVAKQMKVELEAQTQKDLADFAVRIDHDIATQRQMAITELRAQAAKAAIALTEKALPGVMNQTNSTRLMDQFVNQLDSLN